ncbi:hypothetical protein FBU30_009286 [Linnemannia zychae]|nr:hypothetical protein FBU30_009286 [Linnemannia zychae]
MTSPSASTPSVAPPGQKLYSAPGVSGLPFHQRPLPPGWIAQYDPTYQAYFYIDERTNPPTVTWEDPRPAYYMAQERGQHTPPPPGIQSQSYSPQPQQQGQRQPQYQTVQTIQHNDGTTTTITSNGQPIQVLQASPQQQQQQQQQQRSSGSSLGSAVLGAAVVSSMLRPRTRVVVAPRRRRC